MTLVGLRVAIVMLLARLLKPADFGVATACILVGSITETLAVIGFTPSLVQRPTLGPATLPTAFTSGVALAVLGGGLLLACGNAAVAASGIEEVRPLLPLVCIGVICRGFGATSSGILQRELNFRLLTTIEVVAFITGNVLVCVPLALVAPGPSALVIGSAVEALTGAILLVCARRPGSLLRFSWLEFTRLFRYSLSLHLARLANFAMRNGDRWIVGRGLGPVTLGYYSRASQTAGTVETLFANVIGRVLFAGFSRIQDNLPLARAAYLRTLGLLSVAAFPASAWLIVCADVVVRIVLGESWLVIQVPFQIVCAGLFFRICFNCMVNVCRSRGEVASLVWYTWVCAAVTVSACLALQRHGINALASVGILVGICQFVLFGRGVSATLQLTVNRQFLVVLPGLAAGGVSWVALAALRHVLDFTLPPHTSALTTALLGAVAIGTTATYHWFRVARTFSAAA